MSGGVPADKLIIPENLSHQFSTCSLRLVSQSRHAEVYFCRTMRPEGFTANCCLKLLRGQSHYLRHQRELLSFLSEHQPSDALQGANVSGVLPVLRCGMVPHWVCSEKKERLYVVAPWVEGVSLDRLLVHAAHASTGGSRILLSDVLNVARLLACAIRELGSIISGKTLVHQDIKPSNIIVTLNPPMRVTLVDYDTAFFLGDQTAVVPCGTFGYTAPECILGGSGAASSASDVFSFGIVAHEMLTGRWPYPFRRGVADEHWFWHSFYQKGGMPFADQALPAGIRELIESCIAINPLNRPSPEQLVLRVERLIEESTDGCWECSLTRTDYQPLPTPLFEHMLDNSYVLKF